MNRWQGMGASFITVGICSGLIVLALMVVGAVIGGRLVNPKNQLI